MNRNLDRTEINKIVSEMSVLFQRYNFLRLTYVLFIDVVISRNILENDLGGIRYLYIPGKIRMVNIGRGVCC